MHSDAQTRAVPSFLCGGQSNMQYTPHSMAGMNNLTAELAAADAYGDTMRLFTAGMESVCGTPGAPSGRELPRADCSKPCCSSCRLISC